MATMIALPRPPFFAILLLIVLLLSTCCSADPDPQQNLCVVNLNASISVNGFPCKPVPEVKISMNRVDFTPGGVNPPNIHPCATETGVVMKGKLLVGFVTMSNVLHSKVLKAGDMFVIPRGLVHFQRNVRKGKALVIAAFNSQLPGIVVLPTTLFVSTPPIPNDVLTKAFQVDEKVVSGIKSKFGF
ncbi:hypothetical protein HHK36_007142 [Tetracentron sinense]|uniref:Germin-like protein n=1 Tax=Tetracentron sinense TaxID=13715 RepID=A0A835DPV7_TETSI|nr:hypothetical protein HHK36_007142 [Tetracentron sinense]